MVQEFIIYKALIIKASEEIIKSVNRPEGPPKKGSKNKLEGSLLSEYLGLGYENGKIEPWE